MKKPGAQEIAQIFKDKINDPSLISEIFEYLHFDCKTRAFIDPDALDESIRNFDKEKTPDALCVVIDLMLKAVSASSMSEQAFLNSITKYIQEHLFDDINVEDIADSFHVSYYYLCHIFKKLCGKTINQYKNEKILEIALRRLVETDEKISDVAKACGFDNFSYFSEIFLKYVGMTPSEVRKGRENYVFLPFYEFDDLMLSIKMDSCRFLELDAPEPTENTAYTHVHDPGEEFGTFLHEAAIISYKGTLFASWYNCPQKELMGYTPIVGRRSYDLGKTWTAPEIIADDKSATILYCPPVYGICDDRLYMMINQMVSPDHIHSLDLYVLNEKSDKFELVWSRPIPFKLNTNVVQLPNGKLVLPGRVGELDGFPNTPAVMISDSGKMDAEWRIVKVAENGNLIDGSKLVHPETTLVCCDDVCYLFNRNDLRNPPLVYVSKDFCETWSAAMTHDIPYRSTKIYAGKLNDGRFYLVANPDHQNRSKLMLYISDKNRLVFTKQKLLIDCKYSEEMVGCHYPGAFESDGKLYIIATASYSGSTLNGRGAVLFTIDVNDLSD